MFVPEAFWLTVEAERARYAHHDNTAANDGYVKFLGQVADVVEGLVGPGARILDFGSGVNQVLSGLLRARGRECTAFDPLYDIGGEALRGRYDVIVLCEVIEHLRDLRGELSRLAACLAPNGSMIVRTQCYPAIEQMATWWYARDPTHINFFLPRSLEAAAGLCGLGCTATATPHIVVWSPPG